MDRIEQAAGVSGSVTFVVGGDEQRVPWSQLHEEARGVAARLQAGGIGAGAHVSILAPTSRALVTMMQATWLVGGTLIVLPLPMKGAFKKNCSDISQKAIIAIYNSLSKFQNFLRFKLENKLMYALVGEINIFLINLVTDVIPVSL